MLFIIITTTTNVQWPLFACSAKNLEVKKVKFIDSRSWVETILGSKVFNTYCMLFHWSYFSHHLETNSFAGCLPNILPSCMLPEFMVQQGLIPTSGSSRSKITWTLLNTGETLKLMCREMILYFYIRERKFLPLTSFYVWILNSTTAGKG